jgi:CheY-like chemotaxis protein/tetratricopeptide (TPR) repeat protein
MVIMRAGADAVQKTSHAVAPRVAREAETRTARTTRSPFAPEKSVWRIAIVDDDAEWLELASAGLSRRGYEVATFERGQEILDSPLLRGVDLVVLDYHLPDFDGVSLCEAIHQLRPTVRTILCTGDKQNDVVVAALREGLNDYIQKPVSIEALDNGIRRLLDDGERARLLRRRVRLRLDSGKMIPGTPYRLDGWIGEGGMGTVYRGTHIGIERRVALKVLHHEHCVREASVRTFRNEARASARIGAPNIVDIFDFAELADGRLLIAMEYLEGVPLDHLLRSEKIELPRLIAIARQMCRGLAAAHDAGIVHRDIKPANVMLVQRDGRADFVKLVDFGIAAFQSEHGGAQPLAGTPHYMAPESIQFGVVDQRVDEYALGCLLYEWASGNPPFDGETDNVLRAQIEEAPAPLPDVPDVLAHVILRCLSKQPDDRFGSMRELEAALCEVQIALGLRTAYDDLPLPQIEDARREALAARMPQGPAVRVHSRRRRIATLVGGIALLGLSGLGWLQQGSSAPPPDDDVLVLTEVGERVEQARLAASRSHFVYPPPHDPDAPTAYAEIAALESMATEPAIAAAAELRTEFADTLARLGDRYWAFEHGRGFAREYYAMACLFAPDHPWASERAALTGSMLEDLQARAAARSFGDGELTAVQPLLALAEDDPVERSEKLKALQDDPSQPSTVVHRIARLEAESTKATPPRPAKRAPAAAAVPAATPQPATSADQPRTARATTSHLKQAERALAAGRLDDAEVHFHRAIDADPNDLRALDGLAAMHYDAGQYSKSVRFARLAADRGKPSGRRFIALGDAYYKVLRYSDAKAAYERALQLGTKTATGRIEKVRSKLAR